MLKQIGFVALKNDINKLEYINKSSTMNQEQINLRIIANGIHNYLLSIQNTQYLKNKRKNNATTHQATCTRARSSNSTSISNSTSQISVESLNTNQIINLLSRETLATFTTILKHYRTNNCLDALKHELSILYYLQDVWKLLAWGPSLMYKYNSNTVEKQLRSIYSNFIVDGLIKPGLTEFVGMITRIMWFTITTRANIARNNSNGICGWNCINIDSVSHVDYIVSNMTNNPRNIAQSYCSQATQLGLQGLTRKNISIIKCSQQLQDNQNEWFCYYCMTMNDKICGVCPCCSRGLNPLYFSMKNESKNFTVNPDKFGIIMTFPTKNPTLSEV